MNNYLELIGLTKYYKDIVVLKDINLSLTKGEMISILGKSGSGKTTLLKLISGLIEADRGSIAINNKDISDIPANKRNIALVFQEHLLFPHLNLAENVEFSLKMNGIGKKERYARAIDMLNRVQLAELKDKYPHQISGGQRQRAAIARALVSEPCLLLMDEPFSNLDANLRVEMCEFIKELQKETGLTTIMVTHDRNEAMKLSHRIAIINEGSIVQIDTPQKLYNNPIDSFVACFMGDINIISRHEDCDYIIRPEDISISRIKSKGYEAAEILSKEFLGAKINYKVKQNGLELTIICSSKENYDVGDTVYIYISDDRIIKTQRG